MPLLPISEVLAFISSSPVPRGVRRVTIKLLVTATLAHHKLLKPKERPCAQAGQPSSVLRKGRLTADTVEGKRSNLGALPASLLSAGHKEVSHEPPNTRKPVV